MTQKYNQSHFHSTSSDGTTASTLRRMRSGDSGPNSSPSINLQRPNSGGLGSGRNMGNTPNSVPSDTNSGMNYGQPMVRVNDPTMVVAPISGIPHKPDPNEGGADNLQKGNRNLGFVSRKSGGG